MASNPDDGWAYSKIELEAIMDIPVHIQDILDGRDRRAAYFDFVKSPAHAQIIRRATYYDLNDSVLEKERDESTEGKDQKRRNDAFLAYLRSRENL